jgi:hypothetical protein
MWEKNDSATLGRDAQCYFIQFSIHRAPPNETARESRRKFDVRNSIHDVYDLCLESDNHVAGDEISATYLLESLLLCLQGNGPGSSTLPGEFNS